MAAKTYEVVIVGAGIMGSTTAYYLAKHFGEPSKVLLLEQFDCLHKKGSSHGESRIIRRTYVQDHYTMLTKDAFSLWREAEEAAQTKLLTMTGGIDFFKKDSKALQSFVESCKKHNVEVELLGAEELKKKFPVMKMPEGFVGLHCPEAGIIRATKAVATFQTLAIQHGCDLEDNSRVAEIIEEESATGSGKVIRIITNTGREFIGKKCIIVAGPWSQKLLKKSFGVDLPLKQIQTTVAYWKVTEPKLYSASVLPVFVCYDEPMVYGTPILEYPNLIKCCPISDPGPYCDPDDRTFQPRMDIIETRSKRFLEDFFNGGVHLEPVLTETCICTDSPDEDYIIDRIPAHPNSNVITGCGFSGHGFKLGVVVGKILAELAITGEHLYPDIHKHFAISRFSK